MLLWTNIKQKNLHISIDHTPSCIHFCKRKHTQEGTWSLYIFLHNHNYQEDTGKFIYRTLILDNKQLLSNMICNAKSQKCHTSPELSSLQIHSYTFYSNYPAILCIIAIASYKASQLAFCYIKATLLNKDSKQLAIQISS